MDEIYELKLNPAWMKTSDIEYRLGRHGGPHQPTFTEVVIRFPSGCRLFLDAIALLLALTNQLSQYLVKQVLSHGRLIVS